MIRTPLGLRLFPNTSVREQIQEAARLGAEASSSTPSATSGLTGSPRPADAS